jgi:hypothetical protein
MPSLRNQFRHFYAPGEDDIATAMKTGLVVPDTNVLLNFYRYQASARDQLAGALEMLGSRLWIPYQVGYEFHQRRLDVMTEQESYFTKARDEILAAVEALHGRVRAFGARNGLGPEHIKSIGESISELKGLISDEVMKAQELNEVRLDGHATDAVLARIDALFADADRVGEPMPADELDKARAEAERRNKDSIPPGYKDRAKADPAGDYLLWAQTITEAKKRQLPVILITDDTKQDWYQEHKGRTIGARRELREEMMSQAGVPLLIMTTSTFLHHAGTHLNAEVSQETVDQAREISRQVNVIVTSLTASVDASVAEQPFLQHFFNAYFRSELANHLVDLSDKDWTHVAVIQGYFEDMAARGLLEDFLEEFLTTPAAARVNPPDIQVAFDSMSPNALARLFMAARWTLGIEKAFRRQVGAVRHRLSAEEQLGLVPGADVSGAAEGGITDR